MLRRDRPGDAASGLKGDAALLAERGEVEVDDLAGHQPITERVPRWRRDSEPVSEARSVERSPYDDGVVPERHPLVRWGEVGER